jgi:predicted site-specific integrase-resolvase
MPMTISSLAEACGVSRQRIYVFIKEGRIQAVPMPGGYVVMPHEVKRVLGMRKRVQLRSGAEQVRFDFSKI